jgi:hypothetical protein
MKSGHLNIVLGTKNLLIVRGYNVEIKEFQMKKS